MERKRAEEGNKECSDRREACIYKIGKEALAEQTSEGSEGVSLADSPGQFQADGTASAKSSGGIVLGKLMSEEVHRGIGSRLEE